MKKLIIIAVIFLGFSSTAKADWETSQVAGSSITVHIVAASSGTASQMDPSSILMAQREVIEIQNLHETAVLWCSQLPNVTANNGRMITANGGTWVVAIPGNGGGKRMSLYCVSDLAGGESNVAVTQAY